MNIDRNEFEEFELEHDLFEISIDGVRIWERIRHNVFDEVKSQNRLGQAHTEMEGSVRNYAKGLYLFIKNIFVKNPLLADTDTRIMSVSSGRREQKEDGYWWDLHLDPIYDNCDLDYVHFETPYMLEHTPPQRTEDLRYLELVKYGGKIQETLGLKQPNVPVETNEKLNNVRKNLLQQFDTDIDLVKLVESELHARNTQLWLYRLLLDHIKPELVLLVCSYDREILIEACQNKGIPTVELQHGVIHEGHLGYSYPGQRIKELFPDYLLVWGDFWKNRVEYPIPNERVLSVGYPHLEQSMEKYADVKERDQILFISQGTIGEQLSKFALEVAQHPEIDHDIVYKLHPSEYKQWQEEYPWLVDVDFEVISDSGTPLYRLFAESNVQIGVYSTAIYEGLHFGLETHLYDHPNAEILRDLINHSIAERVSSADELVSSLGKYSEKLDARNFFEPKSTTKICGSIEEILQETSTKR